MSTEANVESQPGIDAAYFAGHDAYGKGNGQLSNPYPPRSPQGEAWNEGWEDGWLDEEE